MIPLFEKLSRFKGDVRRILHKIMPRQTDSVVNISKANRALEQVI